MAFNDLMHRQFEYKGNRLPEEVSEFSGTVVSNLHRAEDMAKKEMVAGAKDLVRMAEEVRTMIMASTMPASMLLHCTGKDYGIAPQPCIPSPTHSVRTVGPSYITLAHLPAVVGRTIM
ncbi:unnamed protein product [Symbiodinium necroappetens]|uniref:Uncharacterized protein n=1 Tax=Symbiodinium necroappetens TaxID=1628268 RepID=A0A812UZR8_9DINO|nr:unnamed protein product [Symbiodinium necroappetens]